jgi:hypothetical protein
MSDNRCTGWFNGWPEIFGGTGQEWLHCCQAHDAVEKSLSGDIALGLCVAEVSPLMGAIMFSGVVLFGGAFIALRGLLKRKR